MDEYDHNLKVACLSNLSDLDEIAAKAGVSLSQSTKNYALRQTLNGLGIWLSQKVVKQRK